MKKILVSAALALVSAAAFAVPTTGTLVLTGMNPSPAQAGRMYHTGDPSVSAYVGGIDALFDDGGFIPASFTLYCTDLFTSAGAFGQALVYNKTDSVVGSPYTEIGKVFSYAYSLGKINLQGVAFTAQSSAALQLAIWELQNDANPTDVSAGEFYAKDISGQVTMTASRTEANDLLAGGALFGNFTTISSFTDNNGSKPIHQSFINVGINSGGSCDLGNSFGCVPTSAVPEPSSYALLLAGLGAIGFVSYRRKPSK